MSDSTDPARWEEPDLDSIQIAQKPRGEEQIKAALRILKIRREVMGLVFSRREVLARRLRFEANAEEAEAQLADGRKKTDILVKRLKGLAGESRAKADGCAAQAFQCELEVATLMLALTPSEV